MARLTGPRNGDASAMEHVPRLTDEHPQYQVPAVPNDLLAIAFVRRALLELGAELQPESHQLSHIGPLEQWIHEPLEALDGRTPMQTLAEPEGELLLREYLVRALNSVDESPPQCSLFGDLGARSRVSGQRRPRASCLARCSACSSVSSVRSSSDGATQ